LISYLLLGDEEVGEVLDGHLLEGRLVAGELDDPVRSENVSFCTRLTAQQTRSIVTISLKPSKGVERGRSRKESD